MRRLPQLAALLALAAVPSAHAQALSLYLTFSPAHLSNVETGDVYSANTGYSEQTTSYWASGVGGGITANFLHIGPVRAGFDLRGSTKPGTSGLDSALFGLKVSVHPPLLHIKPYLQGSVGYLNSRTTNVSTNPSGTGPIGGTFSNQYAAYEIMGGLDYAWHGPLDFRIVEVGAGEGLSTFNGNFNPTFFTINSGIVLHF